MGTKLTDEEIVKVYKYCVAENGDCDNCPYDGFGCEIDGNDIIDLIHRLQAENEELKKTNRRITKDTQEDISE